MTFNARLSRVPRDIACRSALSVRNETVSHQKLRITYGWLIDRALPSLLPPFCVGLCLSPAFSLSTESFNSTPSAFSITALIITRSRPNRKFNSIRLYLPNWPSFSACTVPSEKRTHTSEKFCGFYIQMNGLLTFFSGPGTSFGKDFFFHCITENINIFWPHCFKCVLRNFLWCVSTFFESNFLVQNSLFSISMINRILCKILIYIKICLLETWLLNRRSLEFNWNVFTLIIRNPR